MKKNQNKKEVNATNKLETSLKKYVEEDQEN